MAPAFAIAEGYLGDWAVQTGSGDSLTLHEALGSAPATLVAIVASNNQENGQTQQKDLLDMHQQLAEISDDLPPILHLSIIAGAPRLVHGFIRRGIAGEYASPVQEDDVLLMFTRDYNDFTAASGLAVDDYGTWVLVDEKGQILWSEKQTDALNSDLVLRQIQALGGL
ncbi:hypothetical protein ACFOSD_03580 [Salinispirillum marinum]|uniref:Uncharacterized protein n=2 Tax=Saccharospirillaceae TaxID=255527 RepID=A0ABV8BB97_9GAMM